MIDLLNIDMQDLIRISHVALTTFHFVVRVKCEKETFVWNRVICVAFFLITERTTFIAEAKFSATESL